jgi:hypothetical protein
MTDTAPTPIPARTLHFPEDRAVGMVIVAQPEQPEGAPALPQPAQGVVEVPEGATVLLTASVPGQPDADALRALAPDGVDALIGVAVDDDVAEALGGMTAVYMLAANGEVGDRGLAGLGKLTRLNTLVIGLSPDATADGVSRLAALPGLRTLTLTRPVTAELLAPLAEAPSLAHLQIPGTDPAVVDAARDILPNATVNGVWLSPKARAKLAARGA